MPLDRALGHEELETVEHPKAPPPAGVGEDWPKNTAIILYAAASPAHGCCCCDDFVEEYERWDGMA